MLKLDAYELGGLNKDVIQLETSEENNLCATTLAQQCKRSLDIASRTLDPLIYDQINFVAAVKKFVLNSNKAQVRIIVWEPEQIVRRGHRLLEPINKLSSYIEIRKAGIEHKDFNSGLLIADNMAYMNRKSAERFESLACFNAKRQATLYSNEFEAMWNAAKPDPNFRRFLI